MKKKKINWNLKNQKVSTGLGLMVLVVFTISALMFVWMIQKNQPEVGQPQMTYNVKKTLVQASADISSPFQYSKATGFYGTLTITGYLDLKQHACEPGGMCTKTVNYASFVIVYTDNKPIYDFINENKGNSYVGDNSIGLGCYEKSAGRIYSTNSADTGISESIISGNDLQKLLDSNKNNLVKLQITKPIFTSGEDASDCYSHFRLFKILP